MSQNSFNESVSAMFKGMDGIMSTKTVVGEPIHVDDTIIIPLADVSFHSFGVQKMASSDFGAATWINPHMEDQGLYQALVDALTTLPA